MMSSPFNSDMSAARVWECFSSVFRGLSMHAHQHHAVEDERPEAKRWEVAQSSDHEEPDTSDVVVLADCDGMKGNRCNLLHCHNGLDHLHRAAGHCVT